MKKSLCILCGALTYVILSLILSGYGNVHTHRALNEAIVDVFLSEFGDETNKAAKFFNYEFDFKSSFGLKGEAITEGGLLYATNSLKTMNASDWIKHGGFSADEPQLPASLRHFYDPTQPPGEQYLRDMLDFLDANDIIENPRIDHVTWGISHSEHQYSYKNGKMMFVSALQDVNDDGRNQAMAFAWRALGETLHLIGDMGIPSHVRDDAHPAKLAEYTNYMGDPDPLEEICEVIARDEGITDWLAGEVDPAVTGFSKYAKTAKIIAEQLASYTNSNFFSNQTISGENVEPKIHKDKNYRYPKLEDCIYDSKRSIYLKEIGVNSVYMCKDFSYWHVLNGFRGYPYIDRECVRSQARALTPQIVEAGINVIRCFIPKIRIKIVEISGNNIKGEVVHYIDEEYPDLIKYQGLVSIRPENDEYSIGAIMCKDGVFDGNVDLSGVTQESGKIIAELECGNIKIKSEPYEAPPYKKVEIFFTSVDGSFNFLIAKYLWSDEISFGTTSLEKPLKWENTSFSADNGDPDLGTTETTIGSLTSDLKLLAYIQLSYEATVDGVYSKSFVHLNNVKMKESNGRLISDIPDGQGKQFVQVLNAESGLVGEEPFTTIVQDWSNTRVSVIFSNF